MKKFTDFAELPPSTLEEGINDPAIFKAIFLAGGPGSGKSFIVGKTALPALGFKVVNSDFAFESALKKAGMEMNVDSIYSTKGQSLRDRATKLTAARKSNYLTGKLGLVIDGTGKNYDKIRKQKAELEKLGYQTAMIFVNTDIDTAVNRDNKRDRTLGPDKIKPMWKSVQLNLGRFSNAFTEGTSKFFVVDNSDDSDYEAAILTTYKKVLAWSKTPITNPIAKRWMLDQKQRRGIKESQVWEAQAIKWKVKPPKGTKNMHPDSNWKGMKKGDIEKSYPQNKLKSTVNEARSIAEGYTLYHKSYTDAINHAHAHHAKSGLSVSDDDRDTHIAMGSKKPGSGKTTTINIPATHKSGSSHTIHTQVYNKGGKTPYELNTYSSKNKTKKKVNENLEVSEAQSMIKPFLAKTWNRKEYKEAGEVLKKIVDRKKKETGGRLRHGISYYAQQVARQFGQNKVDARVLAKNFTEDYSPQKHEWGTPEGTAYYKKLTPGQSDATTKERALALVSARKKVQEDYPKTLASLDTDIGVIPLDNDWTAIFGEPEIEKMEGEIDVMSFEDMMGLDMYDAEELDDFEAFDQDVDWHDEVEITEVLSIQGRMKRRFAARRNRQKLKVARMRASRRAADPARLKKRATRGARNMIKNRIAKGRDISSLPPAEKGRIEAMVQKFSGLVSRMATRMIPIVRKNEMKRLKSGGMKKQTAKKYNPKKAMASASKQKGKKFKASKKTFAKPKTRR